MRANRKTNRTSPGDAFRCVVVGILLLCGGVAPQHALWAGEAVSPPECPGYIWISPGEQFREKNGAATQRYYVRSHAGEDACSNTGSRLQAYCRLTSTVVSHPDEYQPVPVQYQNGSAFVDIQAQTNARVDLCIYGQCSNRSYTARTSQPLYGAAQTPPNDQKDPGIPLPADMPRLELEQTRHTFFLQTGQPYHFDYISKSGLATTAAIIKKGARVQTLALTPEHHLAYTPPHDPELDNAGSYATGETLILVDEPSGDTPCTVTFTLLLHRSLSAHYRLWPGVLLLFAAAGVTLVPVIIKWRAW